MIYRSEIVKNIMEKDGIKPSSNPLHESEIIAPYLTNGENDYESELLFKNMGYTPEQPEHPYILNRVTLNPGDDSSYFPYKKLSYNALRDYAQGTNINRCLTGNNYGFIFKVTSPMKLSEKFSGTVTYVSLTKVNIIDGEVLKESVIIREDRHQLNTCLANANDFKITLEKGYYLFCFYYETSKELHYNDGVLVNLSDYIIKDPGEM